MEKEKTIKILNLKTLLAVLFFGIFGFLFSAHSALAASLYISPSSASVAPGKSVTVSIGVVSSDQAMNAASGVLTFPADKLEVVSVSKTGSIISLWVQEPSSTASTVNFEGIVLNPGYTGSAGKILSVTFKAKAAGAANLSFSSGSVLANDGEGTNILSGMGKATITITGATEKPETPVSPVVPPTENQPTTANLPPTPVVASVSHQNPNIWYQNTTVDFHWTLPKGVTAVSYLVNDKPESNPGTVSDGLVSSYSLKNASDGIGYFHLRYKNSAGWGPIADFRFQVDTTTPAPFGIKQIERSGANVSEPAFVWGATDTISDIDRYEVKIDDGAAIKIAANQITSENPYLLPSGLSGNHRLLVTAFDKAGNHSSANADFTVSALEKPIITRYSQRLNAGEQMVVEGKTGYPEMPILIFVEVNGDNPKITTVRTDAQGSFYYIDSERVSAGIYKIWAQTVNEKGIKSPASDQVTIIVEAAAFDGSWKYLIVLIALLLVVIHIYIFLRRRRELFLRKENIRNGSGELQEALHQAFTLLKERLYAQVRNLEHASEKRRLTILEERMIKEIKKDLADAEKMLSDKISKLKRGKNRV